MLSTIVVAMLLVSPVHARNVPGSASVVQPLIDGAVASSILDTTMMTARDAALFRVCADFVRAQDAARRQDPCEWGISFGGGVRYVEGSPNGYEFDFTSAFGSLVVAKSVNPSTTVVAALIAERGRGDLTFSNGTLDNSGVGVLAGTIVHLNNGLDFSILGGAEWLNYETTRTGGQFHGEYDAVRYMVDTQLRGFHDGGTFFLDYGGGLRFIHQRNKGYTEFFGDIPFAAVPAVDFSMLTALGDLKVGTKLDGFTPYVQVTGYMNFFEHSSALTGTVPDSRSLHGRLGVGVDVDMASGKLSLTTGFFGGEGGFQGVDGAFKFVKTF